MSKRQSEQPRTLARTGQKTGKGLDSLPLLPADDPIFKQGWIGGQTFSGASPKDVRARRATQIHGLEDKPKGGRHSVKGTKCRK